MFSYYLSIACNHCANSICVRTCPTGAMHRDEHGIVSVDHEICVGCRHCEWSCPYFSPQYDKTLEKITKCDFCRDLLEKDEPPACVAACPMRALDYGCFAELVKKIRHGRDRGPSD